ncbi:MAG: hypothetical protein OEY79_03885 [Anaplasmataceae bacterium]|nr:hypothetical protein [Anaplasmataceae bacterium]
MPKNNTIKSLQILLLCTVLFISISNLAKAEAIDNEHGDDNTCSCNVDDDKKKVKYNYSFEGIIKDTIYITPIDYIYIIDAIKINEIAEINTKKSKNIKTFYLLSQSPHKDKCSFKFATGHKYKINAIIFQNQKDLITTSKCYNNEEIM